MTLGREWSDDLGNDPPRWVCGPCGEKHGLRQPKHAFWHYDTCDVCGAQHVPCTEPRRFGGLKPGWEKT